MVSIYERIENIVKDNKNTTFKIIGKQILNDWHLGIFKSQYEISESCFVSLATVTQFAKACLCEGYKELIIRLRVEYEQRMQNFKLGSNIDYEPDKPKIINEIYSWLEENDEFINKFTDRIKETKKLWICPSYQAMYSCRFLEDILTNSGIDVKLVDLSVSLEMARTREFKGELIIVILSGRDTETLNRTIEYLLNFKNELFIITTPNNIYELPEAQQVNSMVINFTDNNFLYKYRAYALITLFLKISEKF
ncbi:hypothetical protein [Spiroplasma turonicum]|uniref:HTH rpiR-type domain-containing protein n=1 Tax=Spiroplasma turonicum TaxID=216946 RepID=A0A0K1P5Y5_9MOLU|nr:hypothetical protein [Spiroplasma turonicum]AKU79589.1 hypothetical protein STURON_00343 [Spiroplasma turonicum]ALX70611.1 transcriptional regulator [Spiroplasma turonicum]